MGDSDNMFGETPPPDPAEEQPSAAELEAAGQSALFGAPDSGADPTPEPLAQQPEPVVTPAPAQPYRVLARKYRPQTFAELIGQDAMVTTLANAIARDRLAHAFLMTGVRGVGKTSTARLIAKALNCVGPDGQGGPTIDPCGQCEPCRAIAEGRHIDVIEMDAASHTGVDDVREIIEAVRYAAVSARYKIYIIDEVHMLSRNAFNALLKTLEEPPAHVKFLFATTEVDKLPITVLSRCQRFDLRRIPKSLLEQQFTDICAKEGVEAEPEALAIIATAAEGSSRDGLSILDQAIAHADLDTGGRVTAERVRDMLGLSDRTAQGRLFTAMLAGEANALLDGVDQQYALGVDPLALMRGLMDIAHRVTVAQVGRDADARTEEERAQLQEWAERMTPGQLHRLWQLLLKGHDEVRNAPDPLVAAQMALLRVMHASDMPDPGSLVKKLESLAERGPAPAASAPGQPSGGPVAVADVIPTAADSDWRELVERVDRAGEMLLASKMRMQVRLVELRQGHIVFEAAPGFSGKLDSELKEGLYRVTGQRWQVERVDMGGQPTLADQDKAIEEAEKERIRRAPLVEAAFAAFPGAEIVDEEAMESAPRRKWSNNR